MFNVFTTAASGMLAKAQMYIIIPLLLRWRRCRCLMFLPQLLVVRWQRHRCTLFYRRGCGAGDVQVIEMQCLLLWLLCWRRQEDAIFIAVAVMLAKLLRQHELKKYCAIP
jgi:hypothetical protein